MSDIKGWSSTVLDPPLVICHVWIFPSTVLLLMWWNVIMLMYVKFPVFMSTYVLFHREIDCWCVFHLEEEAISIFMLNVICSQTELFSIHSNVLMRLMTFTIDNLCTVYNYCLLCLVTFSHLFVALLNKVRQLLFAHNWNACRSSCLRYYNEII